MHVQRAGEWRRVHLALSSSVQGLGNAPSKLRTGVMLIFLYGKNGQYWRGSQESWVKAWSWMEKQSLGSLFTGCLWIWKWKHPLVCKLPPLISEQSFCFPNQLFFTWRPIPLSLLGMCFFLKTIKILLVRDCTPSTQFLLVSRQRCWVQQRLWKDICQICLLGLLWRQFCWELVPFVPAGKRKRSYEPLAGSEAFHLWWALALCSFKKIELHSVQCKCIFKMPWSIERSRIPLSEGDCISHSNTGRVCTWLITFDTV